MREDAGKSNCLSTNGKDWQMLVLGYQGTLGNGPEEQQPGLGCARGRGSGEPADPFTDREVLPPLMEALTEPWLAKARSELERRIPIGKRIFGGEPIPVEGLLEGLRLRLQEILTLTVGACLAGADAGSALAECSLAVNFPGLERLLRQAVFEWVTATETFCERLQRDGSQLAVWMGVANLPPVESASGTAADTHPGGHAVLRVVFEGGRCLYYKPRDVTGEWLWHKLLETIGELEPALQLPAGRLLEGGVSGRYGWMESVRPEDLAGNGADGSAEGAEYWHAAGAMVCLAYHAALTDLHLGNLLATPRGPVVTDAECLGTPESVPDDAGDRGEPSKFLDLLLGTGLLPGRMAGGMPDISGLLGGGGPVPRLRLPRWERGPSGRARLTPAKAFLRKHGNVRGRSRPLAILPDLLAGYRDGAALLLRARETLVAPGAPWHWVLEHAHAPRIVLRDTLRYGLLLSQSLEPGQLGSGYARRVNLLCTLQQGAPGSYRKSILRAELHALLRLHVPRLIVLPGTRTLASHSGRPVARNFARCTPAEEVLRRLEGLSAEGVEQVQVPALLMAMFGAGMG